MTQDNPTWGIVCTTRAPLDEILRFAAYHIDLGVDRLHLFLDGPNRRAVRVLRQHPKIEIRVCNEAFWQRRGIERPEKHQVRQSHNATFIYRQTDLDWLLHIDIDEFLWPITPVQAILSKIPADVPAARIRPIEALSGQDDMYKAYIPSGPDRVRLVEQIYPNYGGFVLGGFLSHVQGKLFVRSGLKDLKDRIHNIHQNNQLLPITTELPQIELCHRHAPDWDHWQAHFRFRLERGSYQPGMAPNVARHKGGLNMHELLSWIEAEQGERGLRAFYDELSGADPDVRNRLQAHGLLRHRPLKLEEKRAKHFPRSS
ncbi:glycosyl transferase family 2 [Ruegeria sp. ANG-S4]|uniref:glycosyltransferase family 2 protein n=1 Tax=Ruegeria sp. ANG-S4 TaxID=1577904 RepID=UPI00057D460E|nr:glycosyltransferase family 2 protein [Ruegeria sp. ANG-S4]KIC44566.1 glycosyl transferase family 2 [Ruegeria sp. ANG-S4]